jgi:hypothetical protein
MVVAAAILFLIGFPDFALAQGAPPFGQEAPPPIAAPPSPVRGRSTLELQQAEQPGAVDDALSRKVSGYLHRHRLPYVNAQVFTGDSGKPNSIVLTGRVRTAIGKQDAESKSRDALRVPAIAISNQIQVEGDVSGGGPSFTAQGPCVTNVFGSTCRPANPNTKAHAFLYRLTPIRNPAGVQGLSGTVNLIKSSNRILQLEFYTTVINVPDRQWNLGFPGYSQLTEWFGVCYDGGFDVPSAQSYTIVTIADDGVAVWIDGKLVNENEDFLGNHVFGDEYVNIEGRPYFSGGDGGEVGIASRPVHLSAGLHRVMIKYWQGWPSYLGVQVWAIPSGRGRLPRGFPPDADLMQLVGPPDGILKCPH